MSEETPKEEEKKEEKPYVPFSKKVDQAKAKARKEIFKKKKKQNVGLNDPEISWASDTISLREDPRFQRYISLESQMISKFMQSAFEDVTEAFMPKNASFGEKMAFKKGMHYGMLKMKARRESLWAGLHQLKEGESNENED